MFLRDQPDEFVFFAGAPKRMSFERDDYQLGHLFAEGQRRHPVRNRETLRLTDIGWVGLVAVSLMGGWGWSFLSGGVDAGQAHAGSPSTSTNAQSQGGSGRTY